MGAVAGAPATHLLTTVTDTDEETPAVRHVPCRAAALCIAALLLVMIMLMTTRSGDRDDAPAQPDARPGSTALAEAVTATRAAASARVELRTTVTGPAGPVVLVHRAAFAAGGARARAESDMSQVAAALEAAGQQLDGDWSQPTGIVVDGDTVFSQLGPMADALGRAPDEWASVRLSEVSASAAGDNDTLALALDPLGPLDLLHRPVVEIGAVGDDRVRGADTEHLRARLDLTGGDTGGPPTGSFEGRLVAAGVDELPVDVWIGRDGMVHRLQVSVDAAGSLTTTFDVFDVGADVDADVAAPDPADVIGPGARR